MKNPLETLGGTITAGIVITIVMVWLIGTYWA